MAAEAPLQQWASPSRRPVVSPMPCESCRERGNEVSGQLTALSCCLWVAMAQRVSCRASCLFFVSAFLLCPALWASKGSRVRQHYSITWTGCIPFLDRTKHVPENWMAFNLCLTQLVGSCALLPCALLYFILLLFVTLCWSEWWSTGQAVLYHVCCLYLPCLPPSPLCSPL